MVIHGQQRTSRITCTRSESCLASVLLLLLPGWKKKQPGYPVHSLLAKLTHQNFIKALEGQGYTNVSTKTAPAGPFLFSFLSSSSGTMVSPIASGMMHALMANHCNGKGELLAALQLQTTECI